MNSDIIRLAESQKRRDSDHNVVDYRRSWLPVLEVIDLWQNKEIGIDIGIYFYVYERNAMP